MNPFQRRTKTAHELKVKDPFTVKRKNFDKMEKMPVQDEHRKPFQPELFTKPNTVKEKIGAGNEYSFLNELFKPKEEKQKVFNEEQTLEGVTVKVKPRLLTNEKSNKVIMNEIIIYIILGAAAIYILTEKK